MTNNNGKEATLEELLWDSMIGKEIVPNLFAKNENLFLIEYMKYCPLFSFRLVLKLSI